MSYTDPVEISKKRLGPKGMRQEGNRATLAFLQAMQGQMGPFGASPLQTINPAFASASFLPSSVANPFASQFGYQRTPGAQYANYAMAAPNVAGPLLRPTPPQGFVPPGTEPEVIDRRTSEIDLEEDDQDTVNAKVLANINAIRARQGLEPLTLKEFQDQVTSNLNLNFDIGPIGFPLGGIGGMAAGGIASLSPYANGGDVEFPRMNGQISGPGTETSDDIPAMLSDGEFVVNAKAVRGIGRLKGAGKTKEEQRREGARMMYALQRAGEQAIGKAR